MESVTTLPRGRDFTPADLEALPDDGNRYELLDGAIIVTPSPRLPHQGVVGELYLLLRSACPASMRVYVAPLDITLGPRTVLQPDLLATSAAQATGLVHDGVPLLAIEVLSPSTRRIDLVLKRSRYEEAGCASYWVVDPAEPSLKAWDLVDGVYVEVAAVVGDQVAELALPFPVRVVPSALVG